jgi:8-oxo-dGTP pyrophosphatase MutT (NUDIX family)
LPSNYLKELRALVGTRPLITVGSAVLVFDNDGRILLQKRSDDGTWGPIGGVLEIGESLEDAARRELREEAALEATTLTLLCVLSGEGFSHRYPNGDEIHNVSAVFLAEGTRPLEGLTPDAETLELGWFAPSALPKSMSAINRKIVTEALRSRARL